MRRSARIIVALLGALCLAATPAFSVTVEVVAQGLSFIPPDVIVNAGDSVHWTGLGTFHNVAEVDSDTATVYNGGFRSGNVGAVSQFTHVFNTPGIYYYICEPHVFAGMRGSVQVNAAPAPAVTSWGMASMVVLLLSAGGVVLYRRRQRALVRVVSALLGASLLSAPAYAEAVEVQGAGFPFVPTDVTINVADSMG